MLGCDPSGPCALAAEAATSRQIAAIALMFRLSDHRRSLRIVSAPTTIGINATSRIVSPTSGVDGDDEYALEPITYISN